MKISIPQISKDYANARKLGIAIVLFIWGKVTGDYRPFLAFVGAIALIFGFSVVNEVIGGVRT